LKVKDLVKRGAVGAGAKKLFTYAPVHSVRLHDWRLGVLFKFLQLGVFLYTLIYLILVNQRYLLTTVPIGNIDVSLQSPQTNYGANFTSPPPTSLPYCSGAINATNNTLLPCLFWTEELVAYPDLEQSAVFITTRFASVVRALVTDGVVPADFIPNVSNATCGFDAPNCILTVVSREPDNYVALVEQFTIRIIHAWQATKFNQAQIAQLSSGSLVDQDGKEIKPTPGTPETIGQYAPDIFMLSTLLQAAGVTLDTNTSDGIVPRYDGVVILVVITYTNVHVLLQNG